MATGQTSSSESSAPGQAQQKAQEVAGQAKEQAQQAAGQARDRVREQVDQRSTQAGEQITSQASDIRTVAEKLREEGKDKPAQLAEQAADRAERVGSYMKDSNADRILGDVEDFARQRPGAVIAGGVALGFAASRFLKASSAERYQQSAAQRRSATPRLPAGGDRASVPRAGYPAPTGTGAI